MALTVRSTKQFGTGYYIFTETLPEKEEPYLFTSELKLDDANLKHYGNTLIYQISKSMDEQLYNDVLHLETCTEDLIRKLEDTIISKFPEDSANRIRQRHEDPNWKPLRPNYYEAGEFEQDPTMFLKGNVFTTQIKDVNGNFMHARQLAAGYYKFKLRACMVYIGAHKREYQVANLQLRISELQYSPVPFDFCDNIADTQLLTPCNSPSMIEEAAQCPDAPMKRKSSGKKPALKRQNVIMASPN